MFSSNASPVHVFIDQQGIIDKAEGNNHNKNSNLVSTKEKITIGITMSSVICFVSDFLV